MSSTNMQYGGETNIGTKQKIQGAKQELNSKEKEIRRLAKLEQQLRESGQAKLADEKKKELEAEKESKKALEKELKDLRSKAQEDLNKKNKEALSKAYSEAGQKAANIVMSGVTGLKSALDKTMGSFIDKQESMAYGLTGTATDLKSVTQTFTKALGSTGVVKQEKVYENLANLIQSGIVFNAEQRAYLATIANDLGMVFDPTKGELPRLINLQRKDLSDERMAIEYSLKEFLNQNYQTSQYIKEGFQSVSDSLIEAQSLMTSTGAMEFESVVQQWLGSMSSVGASTSTINNFANAINKLGSGDLSVLSESPIWALAASNSGIPLGDILNNGLNSSTVNALLKGVAQYAGQIYSNNESNVVLSQLSKIFGIGNVSDLKALSQVGNVTKSGILSTDIYSLLGNMGDYLYTTTKINNSLANFMYSWAMNTASSDTNYLVYKMTDVLSQAAASLFSGTSVSLKVLGNGVDLNLSQLISAVPLLTTIPGLIKSIGGLANAVTSSGSASAIYSALTNGSLAGANQKIGVTGLFTGLSKVSGSNTSGSMVYYNANTTDIGTMAKVSSNDLATSLYTQEEEQKTTNDLYEAIEGVNKTLESFKTTTFGTYTKISETENTVSINSDITLIQDMVTASALNIQNIYALLLNQFQAQGAGEAQTFDLSKVDWNTFDWHSTASLNLKG